MDKVFGEKETEETLKAESRIEGKKVHITDENERKNEIGERKNVGMKEEKDKESYMQSKLRQRNT